MRNHKMLLQQKLLEANVDIMAMTAMAAKNCRQTRKAAMKQSKRQKKQ